MIFVRTGAIVVGAPAIAVEAQELVAFLGPSLPLEVLGDAVSRPADGASVVCAAAVDVVDGQESRVVLAAACASATVRGDHLGSEPVACGFPAFQHIVAVGLVPGPDSRALLLCMLSAVSALSFRVGGQACASALVSAPLLCFFVLQIRLVKAFSLAFLLLVGHVCAAQSPQSGVALFLFGCPLVRHAIPLLRSTVRRISLRVCMFTSLALLFFEVNGRIMRLFEGPYVECFARQVWPGWDVAFSNEADRFVAQPELLAV